MKNKKVLFIVEGQEEAKIIENKKHGLMSIIGLEYEIVTFCNPIYELYEAYKQGEYDDIVAYLRQEKGLKIADNILSRQAFAAVYLIFDFEPHYQKYSDGTIKDLLLTFNNETELGKLYINYPMVEAIYHLTSIKDNDYLNRRVSLEDFNGKKYKKLVNKETYIIKSKLEFKDLCSMIWHNYVKAKKICQNNMINYEQILEYELILKNTINKLDVIATMPLLMIDYNEEYVLEIIQNSLGDVLS